MFLHLHLHIHLHLYLTMITQGDCFMDSLWNLVQYHGIEINARTILELREDLVASMEQHPMLQNWMSMFWGSLKTNFKRCTYNCTCVFYPLCTCN